MSMIDKVKAELDFLKFAIGALLAIVIPLIGWIFLNFEKAFWGVTAIAVVFSLTISFAIYKMVNTSLIKIDKLEEL